MEGRLHSVVSDAARGILPSWARVAEGRRGHLERVAGLLRTWAEARGLPPHEVVRWTAVGYLHDALRDAPPADVRELAGSEWDGAPWRILHGPAAAALLRGEGVEDPELLRAVAFHTVGSPDFGALGLALFAADFLEPGRDFLAARGPELRERAPGDLEGVAREVLGVRLRYLVEEGLPLPPVTVEFWNRLTGQEVGSWGRVSGR